MNPATLFTQFIDEVWNKSNQSFIENMLDESVITHGLDPSGTSIGKKAFLDYYLNMRATFPETHFDIQPLVHDDTTATLYCSVTAKDEFGKTITFSGISTARFEHTKIAESWNCYDFLKMYQQLGHILVSSIKDE